jgi:hypothetical protein
MKRKIWAFLKQCAACVIFLACIAGLLVGFLYLVAEPITSPQIGTQQEKTVTNNTPQWVKNRKGLSTLDEIKLIVEVRKNTWGENASPVLVKAIKADPDTAIAHLIACVAEADRPDWSQRITRILPLAVKLGRKAEFVLAELEGFIQYSDEVWFLPDVSWHQYLALRDKGVWPFPNEPPPKVP